MLKRSRSLEDAPDTGQDDPLPSSTDCPPSSLDEDDRAKRQRIKDYIFAQTAVDPTDQLRTDQLAFIPRSYQLELAELAKSGNVLVCLDTGSGKTLISVLLLQHIHQRNIPPSPAVQRKKVSFFLVNLVPLVHQQSSVIAGHSDLAVGKLYGELKDSVRGKSKLTVDGWRAEQWTALLESHDVIVSTAQCFLDALIHGFVKMADVALLIFDEVHHALKNHPYLRIMKYYRLVEPEQRPKVFGMTASPIFTNGGRFDEAARYLQQTMDARIHTVSRETLDALHKVKQQPEEMVIEYAPYLTVLDDVEGVQMSELSKEMVGVFGRGDAIEEEEEMEEMDAMTRHFEKEVRPKLEYTMRHLGPVGCDLLWHSTLLEYRSRARKWVSIDREKRTLVSDEWILDASMRTRTIAPSSAPQPSDSPESPGSPDEDAAMPSASQSSTTSSLGLGLAVAHLSTHSALNQAILLRMRSQPPLPDILSLNGGTASPKVLRLIETLRCFEPSASDFCGIIFVERRQTATLLVELIKRVRGLEFLHPEFLLGHENGNANGGAPGMDWHDQVQVLNRFRRRKPTNLLVATSIAEEGLDIQAANLVIRFDLFNRHISFLQSRGRARAHGSRYILMAEQHNREHAQAILSAFSTEANRTDWLHGVADPEQWQHALAIDQNNNDDDAEGEESLYEPSTGARLFAEDAPTLVSHYAATLHSEYLKDAVLAYRIDVDEGFHCVLELPSTSAVRSVASGACGSKKHAKRTAAFRACRQLRQLGELDEWLMPKLVGKTTEPPAASTGQVNPHHKAWRGSGQPISIPSKNMDGWARFSATHTTGSAEYYATYLPLDAFESTCQPIVLLTRGELPSTQLLHLLHPVSGRLKDVGPVSLGPVPQLSSEVLAAVTRFTRFVFKLISRKDVPTDKKWAHSQLRRGIEGEPAVLCVPVRTVSGVAKVRSAADVEFDLPDSLDLADLDTSNVGEGQLEGRILVRAHGYHSYALYRFEAVRRDLDPNTPITDSSTNPQTYLTQHLQRYSRHTSRDRDPTSDNSSAATTLSRQLAGMPLLEVTKLAKVQNLLTPHPPSRPSNPAPLRLIVPYFYKVYPLRAATVASVLLLPSILARYDQLLLAHACNVDLFDAALDTDRVLEALTSPGAGQGFDYERLEFLGDTFLKLVATCHTFTTRLGRTEAELHLANKAILTNVRLLSEAKRVGLEQYGVFASGRFVARRFCAPLLGAVGGRLFHESGEDGEVGEVDVIKEKTLSDMVEALIGAALVSGTSTALLVCRKLQLLPSTILTLSDFNAQLEGLKSQSISEGWQTRVSSQGLQHLEGLFKHVYTYPHLGLEAFTHPSLLASVLPSYQRLEFLGDAWLDFFIVSKIFTEHPHLSPGEMTALKGLLASNAALGALGHRLGLHKYVASNSTVLAANIKLYATALDTILKEGREEREQYWTRLPPEVVTPKAVADVVEASFASIVVDCAFDEGVCAGVFGRIFAPFYDTFCRWDSVRVRHAKRVVQYLFGALRRRVTTSQRGVGLAAVVLQTNLQELGKALHQPNDGDDGGGRGEGNGDGGEGEGGGEAAVVTALLTPVEARLVVGDVVVGSWLGLAKSAVHLVRATGIVTEMEGVQVRISELCTPSARDPTASPASHTSPVSNSPASLISNSDNNNNNDNIDEDREQEEEGQDEGEERDGEDDEAEQVEPEQDGGSERVEMLIALLDEYEHLVHELMRALGWKIVFQSTLTTTNNPEEEVEVQAFSLAELRALLVDTTASSDRG